jgi:hypothetical protein
MALVFAVGLGRINTIACIIPSSLKSIIEEMDTRSTCTHVGRAWSAVMFSICQAVDISHESGTCTMSKSIHVTILANIDYQLPEDSQMGHFIHEYLWIVLTTC